MSKNLILCFLLFVLSSPCMAELDADWQPKPHDSYEVQDGKILFRKGNAGLIVEVATTDAIAKYYADRGATVPDPLSIVYRGMNRTVVFLMTLINRTNGNLTFTPRYAIVRIKSEAYFSLDYSILMDWMEGMDQGRRFILEESIFHMPEIVSSGNVVSKFLIFPSLDQKHKELRLEMDYLFFEKQETPVRFYFVRKK